MPNFQIDPAAKYILSNAQLGPNIVLASTLKNDSLIFVPLGGGTGSDQLWYFGSTQTANRYRLQNVAKGDFNAVEISTYSGQTSLVAHFVAANDNTGQSWALEKWGDGSVRIQNDLTQFIFLGIGDNGMPGILGIENNSSHWTLSRFGGTVQTVTASGTVNTIIVPSTTMGMSATGTGTTPSASARPSAEPTKAATSKKVLGTGAIAGIAVGGVVALVILGVLLYGYKKGWFHKTIKETGYRQDPTRSLPLMSRTG